LELLPYYATFAVPLREGAARKEYWEFSSAGSEHLPYKQRVGGSNPSTPTYFHRINPVVYNRWLGFFF